MYSLCIRILYTPSIIRLEFHLPTVFRKLFRRLKTNERNLLVDYQTITVLNYGMPLYMQAKYRTKKRIFLKPGRQKMNEEQVFYGLVAEAVAELSDFDVEPAVGLSLLVDFETADLFEGLYYILAVSGK